MKRDGLIPVPLYGEDRYEYAMDQKRFADRERRFVRRERLYGVVVLLIWGAVVYLVLRHAVG